MAYKPSNRRQADDLETELDIRPIMNLMVCLIPLLLAGAQFVKNTQLDVNLPPSSGGSSSQSKDEPEEEKEKKVNLNLTVAITGKGFYISASNVTLYSKDRPEAPTVPIDAEGNYDYLGLRAKLKELRNEIDSSGKKYNDDSKIIITASKEIEYEVYIKTQDAISGEIVNGEVKEIFPVVQIGTVI